MKVKNLLSLAAAMLVAGTALEASATFSIPTNAGGADAEVRESQGAADLAGFVTGTNRGGSTELSTRLATNRSSVSYAKFDISGIPNSSDTAFWNTNHTVAFDIFVRQNGNFSNLSGNDANNNPVNLTFNVLALDPNGTYDANRTDRSGNGYTASNNAYDWVEGDITFYDAPGIQPHCIQQGSCAGADPNDFLSTLGVYDDFDSNVLSLGTIVPLDQHPNPPGGALSAGDRLTYDGSNLRDLVMSARDAGQDTVTIMYHHRGPRDDTNQNALGRNYNLTPKEHTMLDAGGGMMLDNTAGAFSPNLRFIPEPTSSLLVGLACLMGLAVRRRM